MYKSKLKQKEKEREWHINNRVNRIIKIKEAQKKRVEIYSKRLYDLFGNKCNECGFSDIRILEWHHLEKRKGRENCISSLLSIGMGWETIINEANKCVLLCPNCHKYKHLKKENK